MQPSASLRLQLGAHCRRPPDCSSTFSYLSQALLLLILHCLCTSYLLRHLCLLRASLACRLVRPLPSRRGPRLHRPQSLLIRCTCRALCPLCQALASVRLSALSLSALLPGWTVPSALGSANLSPRSRVLRAWRAGHWARLVLQGQYATPLPSENLAPCLSLFTLLWEAVTCARPFTGASVSTTRRWGPLPLRLRCRTVSLPSLRLGSTWTRQVLPGTPCLSDGGHLPLCRAGAGVGLRACCRRWCCGVLGDRACKAAKWASCGSSFRGDSRRRVGGSPGGSTGRPSGLLARHRGPGSGLCSQRLLSCARSEPFGHSGGSVCAGCWPTVTFGGRLTFGAGCSFRLVSARACARPCGSSPACPGLGSRGRGLRAPPVLLCRRGAFGTSAKSKSAVCSGCLGTIFCRGPPRLCL